MHTRPQISPISFSRLMRKPSVVQLVEVMLMEPQQPREDAGRRRAGGAEVSILDRAVELSIQLASSWVFSSAANSRPSWYASSGWSLSSATGTSFFRFRMR